MAESPECKTSYTVINTLHTHPGPEQSNYQSTTAQPDLQHETMYSAHDVHPLLSSECIYKHL